MKRGVLPGIALLFYGLFVLASHIGFWATKGGSVEDRVVIDAPVLAVLYGGDHFLAANLEVFRLASTGLQPMAETGRPDGEYLLRSLKVVADLNPCQEDNYYVANAILAFGGAHAPANDILKRASDCRTWDFYPLFLLGFNHYFFEKNTESAASLFEQAADRSVENSVGLKRIAIVLRSKEIDDAQMALSYLEDQKELARDALLKQSIQKRIVRLKGLVQLREAKKQYENQLGLPLTDVADLINSGIINNFPKDPLGLGYELVNGQFELRQNGMRRMPIPK